MSERNYISAVHDYSEDKILIWERPIQGGERTLRIIEPPRYFYVPDEAGEFTSITNVTLKKLTFETDDEFKEGIKRNPVRFESDIQPVARALMDLYCGVPPPALHYAFLDIETDYKSELGFSSPMNPYAPINAVTIYQSWSKKYLTYAVPPKGYADRAIFQEKLLALSKELQFDFELDVTLCSNERELLLRLIDDVQDADVISGWNSEFFDLPYIVKRIEQVLGKKSVAHLSFKGANPPKERMITRFGEPSLTYVLSGRAHIDLLDAYKKFTFEGRTSYSLANISAEELNAPKLEYDGTLEELYNNDFVYFCAYNIRDVQCLVGLEHKFKFMPLMNNMAHENTVPLITILGTVRYVETGVMNHAHSMHNRICTDKSRPEKNKKVEGAVVMTPLAGLHKWIGSIDIKSLYPSTIRALNMSSETFVGQFVDNEKAWAGIEAKSEQLFSCAFADGTFATYTATEWGALIRDSGYAISAFGTLFDQNTPGMLADMLSFWYNERVRLQAEKKKYEALAESARQELGQELPADLVAALKI